MTLNDRLVYFRTSETGNFKRMAELLHLWRWSGITREELLELRTDLEACLDEMASQLAIEEGR